MNITQLAAQPQLVKITLDSETITKTYGEPVEFYTWDRQPLEIFMKLVSASMDHKNISQMIDVMRILILDEKGEIVIKDKVMLPTDILMEAMGKVMQILGK